MKRLLSTWLLAAGMRVERTFPPDLVNSYDFDK